MPENKRDQDKIKDAITIGQDLIKKKMTKAEASMVMYRLLHEAGCDQEVIVDAFVKGTCKRVQSGEQVNRLEQG